MKKLLLSILAFTLLFGSCVKKPVEEPTGEAMIRFVNAANTPQTQDVYINGSKVQTAPLPYRASSPYISYQSGFNVFAFADNGTLVANSGIDFGSKIGSKTTVFQYVTLSKLYATEPIGDDTDLPSAGKFKVRFIHLNNHLENFLKVTVVGGNDVFDRLNFRSASAYYEFEPGVKFIASATGVTDSQEFTMNGVVGKVYTVWFSGADEKQLLPNFLTHN